MADLGPAADVDAVAFQRNEELFRSFLDRPEGRAHADNLRALVDAGTEKAADGSIVPWRVTVDLNALRRFNPEETAALIQRPMNYMTAFQEAALKFMRQNGSHDPKLQEKLKSGTLQVGFEGSLGNHHVSPRGLLSGFICSLVCVEGIVTKCSLVQPKVVKSVHWCEATQGFTAREYRDATALDLGIESGGRPKTMTASSYPTQDEAGNPLETEFGLSTYKNHQTVVIQEMPERAPLGQLPRSVDLVLDHDLVDKVKPGDRVMCMGVYRAMSNTGAMGTTSGVFKTKVLCNHMDVLGTDVGGVVLAGDDVKQIKALAKRDDVLEVLGRSFAPSVYGHDHIKRALVLQLLGGSEKNLDNGTHLRGDINVLMVGDPSTAKSQLLRAAMGIAPLSVSTTGRGSSGVGLTAAVTNDAETGDKKLEAGAMVLADRGLVCIDEFDKMGDADRVAIHEVMEQQTVTVAKAGIHATLNARCSVLAAANPVYGQYNKDRRPQDNIGLPDSLLSRFDLLFVVLDSASAETDRKISQHVLSGHRYRRPGTDMEPEALSSGMWDLVDESKGPEVTPGELPKTQVWNKLQPVMYGGGNNNGGGREQRRRKGGAAASLAAGGAENEENEHPEGVLHKQFLKKYLHYAKKLTPTLTDEAREYMSAEYASLRAKAMETNRTLPVTARQLETLIRVSTAHAKARLSPTVDEADAVKAVELLQFALYHETGTAAAVAAAPAAPANDASSTPPPPPGNDGGGKRQRTAASAAAAEMKDDESPEAAPLSTGPSGDFNEASAAPGGARYQLLSAAVASAFEEGTEEVQLAQLLSSANAAALQSGEGQFEVAEAEVILQHMENDNQVMYSDGTIFNV